HGLAVHMHDAGAALARIATYMGTGEVEILAQELAEERARIDVGGYGFPVHGQGHGCPRKDLPLVDVRQNRAGRGALRFRPSRTCEPGPDGPRPAHRYALPVLRLPGGA